MANHHIEKFDIDLALDSIDLTFPGYTPTEESLKFFNIIRMVQGSDFEFNTPLVHYWVVDLLFDNVTIDQFPYSEEVKKTIEVDPTRIAIMMSRGLAKSSVVTAFMPVYLAVTGELPGSGPVYFMLSIAASTQGGARVINKSIQSLCEDSEFCKNYFEDMRFTESEIEWVRKGNGAKGNRAFLHRAMGFGSGIRGQRSNYGVRGGTVRPDIIAFDDTILNTQAAYSETIMNTLRETIQSDAINALRGGKKGRIWHVFTPFHSQDVNVQMITSGAYTPVVIPICKEIRIDMEEEEFDGAWVDMHPYDAVIRQYRQAVAANSTKSFNQERMLRISSEDDRMIQDDMIVWYSRKDLLKNINSYNIYITTDFTTTSEAKSDFSAIAAWAINSNGDYFLVDLCVRRQGIGQQYEELFRMVNFWSSHGKAVEVGIETDGQQKAHIFAIKEMMIKRNEWFIIARQKGAKYGSEGILSRSSGKNKHERFRLMVPHFQNKKFHFPSELEDTPDMREALKQLKGATWEGFSNKDDFCLVEGTPIKLADGSIKPIEAIANDRVDVFTTDALTALSEVAIMTGIKDTLEFTYTDGSTIECTGNHLLLTRDGWKEAINIGIGDSVLKIKDNTCHNKSSTIIENGLNVSQDTINVPHLLKVEKVENGYINSFGRKLMESSLKGLMYITKTIIKITMP